MNLKRTLETASPTTTVGSSESEMPLGSITGTFKLQFRQPLSLFIENSCEVVGIEKTERGHQTEYIDTMKNCGYHDVVNEFFVFVLRVNNAKKIISIASRHLESTDNNA